MPDLLALSARIVDERVADEPVNRVTQELSEVADGIAVVESFSHVVALRTDAGLVLFDASGAATGAAVMAALRGWDAAPVEVLVYTHGHLDHVGGSPAVLADAERRGRRRPRVVGHERVLARLARYRQTAGWNARVNARQFGWLRPGTAGTTGLDVMTGFEPALAGAVPPDETYVDELALDVGETPVVLHHGLGETDDHTWAWLPEQRAVCAGDFLIWNFPNAGNPQKVQRFPAEWAQTLRSMAELGPELLLPAHGLPVAGASRIARVLDDVAGALELLVAGVLELMNAGATLDEVVHAVRVPADTLALPYLRPLYDEPEFVVRNIWRLYGGWWDGNAARLHPPADAAIAAEVAALAGGADVLAERAAALLADGDLRLAGQLAEWSAQAAPHDAGIHRIRAAVYEARRAEATSLMAKGIYSAAVRESAERSGA